MGYAHVLAKLFQLAEQARVAPAEGHPETLREKLHSRQCMVRQRARKGEHARERGCERERARERERECERTGDRERKRKREIS